MLRNWFSRCAAFSALFFVSCASPTATLTTIFKSEGVIARIDYFETESFGTKPDALDDLSNGKYAISLETKQRKTEFRVHDLRSNFQYFKLLKNSDRSLSFESPKLLLMSRDTGQTWQKANFDEILARTRSECLFLRYYTERDKGMIDAKCGSNSQFLQLSTSDFGKTWRVAN